VLDLERARHSERSFDTVIPIAENGDEEDWFESAEHVGNIFRSCEVTWHEIDWPETMVTT